MYRYGLNTNATNDPVLLVVTISILENICIATFQRLGK